MPQVLPQGFAGWPCFPDSGVCHNSSPHPATSLVQFSSDEHLANLPGGGGEGEPAPIPEESEGSEQMEEDQAALGKAAVHTAAADKAALQGAALPAEGSAMDGAGGGGL